MVRNACTDTRPRKAGRLSVPNTCVVSAREDRTVHSSMCDERRASRTSLDTVQMDQSVSRDSGCTLFLRVSSYAQNSPKSRLPKPYTLADADPPPVPDPELGPPPGYMGYSYERGPWESRRFGAGFGGEPGQGIAHGIGPGGVSHGRPQSYRGEKMVPSVASGPGEPFIRNVNQKPRDNQNAQVRRGLENILCFKVGAGALLYLNANFVCSVDSMVCWNSNTTLPAQYSH